MRKAFRSRRNERGVSFLLVVAGIFSILAMAALAIDVIMLYTAKSEAQKAADAAALAGAKMFVMSGSTLGGAVDPTQVCTNGAGQSTVSNTLAQAAAGANTVGGAAGSITNVACTLGNAQNPQIQVTVTRTALPLFFGRIFGNRGASVSATAKAEAFNNSGASVPIGVGSVKPWAVANCQSAGGLPAVGPCGSAPYFMDPTAGTLTTPTNYVGQEIFLGPGRTAPPTGTLKGNYYPIDFSLSAPAIRATVCPRIANDCSTLALGTPPYYVDNIACATTNQPNQRLTCGSSLTLKDPTTVPVTDTQSATQCLIHTDGTPGQQDAILPGNPVTIDGGSANPNTALRGVSNISRSDSVVTVPVFTWAGNPCLTSPCATETVVGFLQLGIKSVDAAGNLDTVVVNAVGCQPGGPNPATVAGGALTPLPVRLVQ